MAARTSLTPKQHRTIAADLFNEVWRLMEAKGRTREDDLRMVHAAHASRHHWGAVGTPRNLAVGEWQVSRVYAVLGRGEPARVHAEACLALCRRHRLKGWVLAYAYEALARAAAVAGRRRDRDRYLRLGGRAGRAIRAADDREQFLRDLATVAR
jgi:hypothetical protein